LNSDSLGPLEEKMIHPRFRAQRFEPICEAGVFSGERSVSTDSSIIASVDRPMLVIHQIPGEWSS